MNMKKFGLFAISLMSVSLLASCNNHSEPPTYTVHIEYDSRYCEVSNDTLEGVKGSIHYFTINVIDGYDLANDGLNFVNEQGETIAYDGTANYNYEAKEVCVTIGDSNATLKLTTDVTYKVDIANDSNCTVSKESLVGTAGSTRSFEVTPEDGYIFSEGRLIFIDEEGPITYDGSASYDHSTSTITVTIGTSNAKLVCATNKLNTVYFLFNRCSPSVFKPIIGQEGYSESINIKAEDGYIFNENSFTWVNRQQEKIDYNGNFTFNESYQMVTISVGDRDAWLKCVAFKRCAITLTTFHCTSNESTIIDTTSTKVTLEVEPDSKHGYTLTKNCFKWVDDEDKELLDYDGTIDSYDSKTNILTLTTGNSDAFLSCVGVLRASRITIKAMEKCSTATEFIDGAMGDQKTFELAVEDGSKVNFDFIPSDTGATATIDGNIVTVTIGNNDAILSCTTTYVDYTITIEQNEHWSHQTYSLSGHVGEMKQFAYKLADGYDFAEEDGLYFADDTGATFKFNTGGRVIITFGLGNTTLKCNLVEHWYKYEKWWNYCTGGDLQADESDIGRIVHVTLNGYVHDVRLIDIDHDYLSDDGGHEHRAHCTFEFADVITMSNGDPYQIAWESETDNGFFLESRLYRSLAVGGEIYNMFPTGEDSLINRMNIVTKYVGDGWRWSDFHYIFYNKPYDTKLFPLSFHELVNVEHYNHVVDEEGFIYTYYKDMTSAEPNPKRAKHISKNAYQYYSYLIRSACKDTSSNPNKYWRVNSDGSFAEYKDVVKHAVAPAFCV